MMPPPDYTGFLKLLYDWQTALAGAAAILGGIAAYVAGRIQAGATREAAKSQITAMTRKDRLQAQGIVLGVYPELLEVKVLYERASHVMEQWSLIPSRTINVTNVVPRIRDAKIQLPFLLSRNIENFFLVEPGGASLQQLVTFTLQYNGLVDTLAQQITDHVNSFDPAAHQRALSGNLKVIGIVLEHAIREVRPIHDEATAQ